jgi:hypothetical protein
MGRLETLLPGSGVCPGCFFPAYCILSYAYLYTCYGHLRHIGATANIGLVTAISFGFIIPIIILTFFYDTAAVFEDTKIFDSIRRSIQLVMTHISDVIAFLLVCAGISIGINADDYLGGVPL